MWKSAITRVLCSIQTGVRCVRSKLPSPAIPAILGRPEATGGIAHRRRENPLLQRAAPSYARTSSVPVGDLGRAVKPPRCWAVARQGVVRVA